MTATLLLGIATFLPQAVPAAEQGHPGHGDHSLERVVIEMAQTPAQHAALARHYRVLADEARAEMRHHESMGKAYGAGKLTQRQRMKQHCEALSEKFSGMADDYDALAKLHEEASKGSM